MAPHGLVERLTTFRRGPIHLRAVVEEKVTSTLTMEEGSSSKTMTRFGPSFATVYGRQAGLT